MARILIDECLDRRLARLLPGHAVETVYSLRWTGIPDRILLDRMESRFDVLLTADQSLPNQQNLDQRPFSVIVLRPRRNRLPDVLELLPQLVGALNNLQPGAVVEIAPG
ncbi:MAG: DUF5615 family PIN-like protein [Chloroflexi bacterium]|nr:DUF5615 family PIN-like protein [Chloroflexota bacterium]